MNIHAEGIAAYVQTEAVKAKARKEADERDAAIIAKLKESPEKT